MKPNLHIFWPFTNTIILKTNHIAMRKDFCVCNKWLFDTDKRPSKLYQKKRFFSFSLFQCLMMQSLSLSQVSLLGLISPSACRWRQCREWGRWPQIFRPRCWWSKVGCSLLGGRQRWSYLQLLWSRLLLKRKFNIKDVLQFYWMKYNFWWSNIRIQREEDIKWYPQLPFSTTYLQHPVFADSEQNRRWLRDRWCPWRSLRTDRAWWGHRGPDWTPQISELCW